MPSLRCIEDIAQDNIGLYIKIAPNGTCPSPRPTAVCWSPRSGITRAQDLRFPAPFIRSHPVMPSRDANPLPSFSRRPRRVRRRLDPLPYTDARLHDLRDGVLVPVAGWRRGLTRGNGALNLAATHAVVRRACVVVPRRAGFRQCAPQPAWHADVAPLHQTTRSHMSASCMQAFIALIPVCCAALSAARSPAGAATEPTRVPHGSAHAQLQ